MNKRTNLMMSIQYIICDGTLPDTPKHPFFSYKSTFHQPDESRVHIDFSLHVIDKPSINLGIWRCRINIWLNKNYGLMEVIDRFESPSTYLFEERDATKINVVNNHSMMNELSFYTEGFRLAFSEAERFVERKYSLIHILTPQTKEQLKERFELLESVKIAREKGGVVKRVARKE